MLWVLVCGMSRCMGSMGVGGLSTGVSHVVHKVPLLFVLRPRRGTSVTDCSSTGDRSIEGSICKGPAVNPTTMMVMLMVFVVGHGSCRGGWRWWGMVVVVVRS